MGKHWLLSERPLRLEQRPMRANVDYDIWGPERFAQWLGNAVLNGDLNASTSSNLVHEDEEETPEEPAVEEEEEKPVGLMARRV